MAAPKGNQYAKKGRAWADALNRALKQYNDGDVRTGDALRRIANKVIEKALEGEDRAIQEIGDRLDGRPAQSVAVTGEEGGPIEQKWTIEVVSAKRPDP